MTAPGRGGGPRPIALTIAGSDSSGGAGMQADLKTFSALGVYGASVITALTAQNTQGVRAVHVPPVAFIAAQCEAVFADLEVAAVKTGMLADRDIVLAVADALAARPGLPVVVDPVMVATSGDRLLSPEALAAVRDVLMRRADLITPNLPEAAALLDTPYVAQDESTMIAQGEALLRAGARAVLMKGGHGTGAEAVDFLLLPGATHRLAAPRIATRNTHGTGCTLSAAIAAYLSCGSDLVEAVEAGKRYLTEALRAGRNLGVGRGHGPVDHLFPVQGALAKKFALNGRPKSD